MKNLEKMTKKELIATIQEFNDMLSEEWCKERAKQKKAVDTWQKSLHSDLSNIYRRDNLYADVEYIQGRMDKTAYLQGFFEEKFGLF